MTPTTAPRLTLVPTTSERARKRYSDHLNTARARGCSCANGFPLCRIAVALDRDASAADWRRQIGREGAS